jgi:cephalosporin hydroxylase
VIRIDEERGVLVVERDGEQTELPLDDPRAFALVSDLWLRAGWAAKHAYTFTWLGRPVIQLPEDLIRLQELFVLAEPDVVVETGVAHGGSLVFYAGLCRALGRGRVIGVDVEIRPHNRRAIEEHVLAPLITLVEGDSTAPETVVRVKAEVSAGERVLVVLDSSHRREHVLRELDAYALLVSVESFVVALDGHVMERAVGLVRSAPDWAENNPSAAVEEFARTHPEFVRAYPPLPFSESPLDQPFVGFAGGVLRRVR